MTRPLAEDAERLAVHARELADRLAAIEAEDDRVFSKWDVDRIVESRLAREREKRRRVEAERDELQAEVEGLRRGSGTPAL